MLGYSDTATSSWQHRKVCWQNFHSKAAPKYHPMQRERVNLFLRRVLQEPERVFDHSTL